MRSFVLFISILALLFTACEQRSKEGKKLDTPTTGEIKIMVDEGYRPIVESSINVFDSIYRLAKINAVYTSEGEAIAALIRDSIQVIIVTRRLTAEEENKYFKPRGFIPKYTPIAHDAVAFVVHPDNHDTVFTVEQIRNILNGTATQWKQINPKSALGEIRLVFDNPLSGTVRYAKDSIAGCSELSPNASALKTNADVLDYVSKNKNTIGIIGANWISDTDDKGVQKFLKQVQLCDIAATAGAEGFGPYQAYLATGQYPFKRTVYILNAQARAGLGLGLASFLAGDTGQRIVLKDGLLPAQAPTRLIKVTR